MQPQNPTSISNQDMYNKSLAQVLSNNVSPGNGLTFDTNGQPLTFSPDNGVGIIIRIGSSSNPFSLPANWVTNNTDLTIAHNLGKIPYGYIVIAKSEACDVYWGSMLATTTTITLRNTNAAADTSIWILC